MIGFSSKSNLLHTTSLLTDTIRQTKAYSGLTLEQSLVLPVSMGVKSVLFNSTGTKLYALGLEEMSIYEFDRKNKKLLRKINFKPNAAKGLDYILNKPIPSFAEKPVEACFSHHDKILWVSLHNAGGIVPIFLDSLSSERLPAFTKHGKVAYVTNFERQTQDTLYLPLVQTGKMPKVIAKTADDKYLLVSNWGSKTVSILKINDTLAPYGKRIANITVQAIPRGIAVDDRHKKSYVAVMGGNQISAISHKNWKIEKNLVVPISPRHLVMDTAGRLFSSFNVISQIACIEPGTGKILFKANTHSEPRTIALSKNQKFLFVTCYAGNTIDIYKINPHSFKRIYSLKCTGKPIGIGLYEDEDKLEAWVCNYLAGNLKVYMFKKT